MIQPFFYHQIILPVEQVGSVFLTPAPDGLEFINKGELPQFKVIKFEMVPEKNHSQINVKLKLKRIFTYHITNTFMPTSTLLIIAQATLHFDESKTELAVGLLLTVLLVMYTLYQSITGSLLQTAYLKMIDYWLLFCLFMPFVSFMIEVYLLLDKNQDNLNAATKKWVNNEEVSEEATKKRKRQFLIIAHGTTLTFFTCYFFVALLMYNDVI